MIKHIHILYFAIGILLSALGGIFLKTGAKEIGDIKIDFLNILKIIFLNKYIFFGLIMYFIPAVIWIYLLKFYDLSFLQPLMAITYTITPLMALLILKEPVSGLRRLGILVIIAGVFIVSKS